MWNLYRRGDKICFGLLERRCGLGKGLSTDMASIERKLNRWNAMHTSNRARCQKQPASRRHIIDELADEADSPEHS